MPSDHLIYGYGYMYLARILTEHNYIRANDPSNKTLYSPTIAIVFLFLYGLPLIGP